MQNLSVLLWAKKVFQETRKALKVRRTAVGALLVDMPEHICFRVSFFCGTQIETNHWQVLLHHSVPVFLKE